MYILLSSWQLQPRLSGHEEPATVSKAGFSMEVLLWTLESIEIHTNGVRYRDRESERIACWIKHPESTFMSIPVGWAGGNPNCISAPQQQRPHQINSYFCADQAAECTISAKGNLFKHELISPGLGTANTRTHTQKITDHLGNYSLREHQVLLFQLTSMFATRKLTSRHT